MIEQIPPLILEYYKKLEDKGYEIYFVGGCVRNILMGQEITDWDFTTNATPDEILAVFPEGFYDNAFGTVGVPVSNSQTLLEITTYRTEKDYIDNRHPTNVSWGKTIEEDLKRRDFTINAIAFKLEKDFTIFVDPFNGQKDLENKLIRAVGNPLERFKEDALRLMRAARFATTLNFSIEEKTYAEIVSDAPLLQNIAFERIRDELLKILHHENAYEGLMLLYKTDLLKYIIPELLEGINISQVRPGRHHTSDVFTHNVLSLKFCPSKNPIVKLATLLHDVGKPQVQSYDENGLVIFHNHEVTGAKLAETISNRLKFSKKDREKIVTLIRWHMFTIDEHITDSAVRRFIRRIGVENVADMLDLRIGDRLGGGTQTAESWRLKLFRKRLEEQLQPAPFSINDLVIDGNDIMKELSIRPGPLIGKFLQQLFEEVDEDLSKNTKEYLIKRLHEIARHEKN